MKRFIALLAVVTLLFSGCGTLIPPRTTAAAAGTTAAAAETTEETTAVEETAAEAAAETSEETTEETTEPEPTYYNPLNGEELDAPYENRFFAVSVNNLDEALPHHGTMDADIIVETLVNYSIIRCYALFSDITKTEKVGPIRSDRLMWNDLSLRYDAIITHASGSSQVLKDLDDRGVANLNADQWQLDDSISYRDTARSSKGYPYDATLFAVGAGLKSYAESLEMRTTMDGSRDFRLQFSDDATPADGLTAEEIGITISAPAWTSGGGRPAKQSTMVYDSELGKYVWHQYGKSMVDGNTDEPEAFQNVIIMEAEIYYNGIYQQVDYAAGGDGWFACGGKAIRIHWVGGGDQESLLFTTETGEILSLNKGNTYIAITQSGSEITGIG